MKERNRNPSCCQQLATWSVQKQLRSGPWMWCRNGSGRHTNPFIPPQAPNPCCRQEVQDSDLVSYTNEWGTKSHTWNAQHLHTYNRFRTHKNQAKWTINEWVTVGIVSASKNIRRAESFASEKPRRFGAPKSFLPAETVLPLLTHFLFVSLEFSVRSKANGSMQILCTLIRYKQFGHAESFACENWS